MHNRNVYLKMKTLEEAKRILLDAFSLSGITGSEMIPVTEALGRVLSEPVYAAISSPNFHAAAMDGAAVDAGDTYGAGESSPKVLLLGQNAWLINTGHAMPENTNAVIMVENIHMIDDNRLEIQSAVFPWQNVRRVGEDIVATELLFARNQNITPYCIGALIAAGVFQVAVWKKPKVFIQPTGSELLDHASANLNDLKPGQVLESNSYMLGKLAESCGATFFRNPVIKDDVDAITRSISDAAKNDDFDILFILGGSSAGSEDFARKVIESLGRIMIHGVTMMPGKPVIAGEILQKPVFGMPGYPVSAIIAFEQLVKPMLCRMLNQTEPETISAEVLPTRKIASRLGMEEFLRVKLGRVRDDVVATPLPRAAGCITSITQADGIIRIPNHVEGLAEGKPAVAHLLKPLNVINHTVVVVGSHDNTLDVLADMARGRHSRVTLSSSHVGSMGGLMAIKKGFCHMAGTHLLNETDGSYNISYIKQYLPGVGLKLIRLVDRDQGFMVQPGNPKKIRGLEDLTRDDIVFINRQRGSGTRILLDFKLKLAGITPDMISGYPNEEFTHMAVAAAVASGTADTGLGIYASARALKLDFIPMITESYDIVIPADFMDTDNIQLLLSIINSGEFKTRVQELGGYHTEKTGDLVWTNR
ncbi:MAG: molybdopterin biosynthesis protein [Desulfobacterales bacterium]|jgi:putative molybdopterin biosynthesis protein|nr:molybdopterin biosynthesis protein [Desulfobacterales bacterium]